MCISKHDNENVPIKIIVINKKKTRVNGPYHTKPSVYDV